MNASARHSGTTSAFATLVALLVPSLVGCSAQPIATPEPTAPAFGEPELVHAWTRLDYAFPTEDAARIFERERVFEKALLAGVDVDRRGRIFVTTPRWLDARVPATLSEVVVRDGKPLLRPFPTWSDHQLDTPDGLRNVLGAAIDDLDRLWILDMGWVAGLDTPAGAQKLVVIDLGTGQTLARYAFPDAVADPATSFLNDLAVDSKRGVAYISDSGNRAGSPTASGLIVYDLAQNRAHRVLHRDPRVQDEPGYVLSVAGEAVLPSGRLAVGINGVALSPDGERLFWSITTGDAIYEIPTRLLRDPAVPPAEVAAGVLGPRRIGGGSDGLTSDIYGRIYATNLTLDRIEAYDLRTKSTQIVASGPDFIWPDSLAWDAEGRLYATTNHLNRAFAGAMDFGGSRINFRIFRVPPRRP